MGGFVISAAALTDAGPRELIDELNADLAERYPEDGANHFRLDPAEVAPGRGVFLLAADQATGHPLGCGAVRLLDPGVAEIKRMYVRPAARGRRLGSALLAALEAAAVELGAQRLVLEMGDRQPAAQALYAKAGFVETDRFGDYVDSPLSVCLGKDLPN